MKKSTSLKKWLVSILATLFVFGCAQEENIEGSTSPDESAAVRQSSPAAAGGDLTRDVSSGTSSEMEASSSADEDLEIRPMSGECCTEVGQADECWMEDATDDGIICPTWVGAPFSYSLTCIYGSCNADSTLCACENDSDCNDGTNRFGQCVIQPGETVGECGPSWCNGYKICSCWGGCVDASLTAPEDQCADQGFTCCEGDYPENPTFHTSGQVGNGFCSDDATCGSGCSSDADCDDSDVCTIDTCVIATGQCTYTPDPSIDDGNVCTDDACHPVTGITHVNNADPCDADGDGCTVDDMCSAGTCVAGPAPNCNDGNICTDDSCVSTAVNSYTCDNPANTDPCDDGNACTTGDVCSGGSCTYTGTLTCDDTNACTDDGCDPASGCVFVNNSDSCDDGDACTTGDVCSGGSCTSTGTLTCTDGKYCTTDSCDSTLGCVFTNNTNSCDDGNACTSGDACSGGFCVGTAITCNDANGCTDDSCNPALGCVFNPNTDPCNDGNACTTGDVCSGGSCTSTGTLDCDDTDVCTDDSCDSSSGCVYSFNSASCNDGDACTTGDVCSSGSCVPTGSLACNDGNLCTDDSCDSISGCVFTNNTVACDDADACTTGDVCSGGSCTSTGTLTCNDSNICTNDSCNSSTGCVFTNNTASCDDSNACTSGDVCSGGSCVGAAVTCNDGDVCTTDTCVPASGCNYTAIPNCCENDSECTSFCPAGYSTDCATPRCISNSCTCVTQPAGTSCDDFDTTTYPLNCFTGFCGEVDDPSVWYPTFGSDDGLCQPVEHPAFNNLCSDLFSTVDFSDPDASTDINEGHDGYIGLFENDGSLNAGPLASTGTDQLIVTGSTRCAFNNYESVGDDCDEWSISGDPIGIDGLDLVYVFEYETNSATQMDLYSYLVKLEGDFDLGMYVMTEVDTASDCPEGDNPTHDDSDVNPAYFWSSASSRCSFPYSAAPTVVEDYCDPTGNDSQSPPQTCCDPCADPGCYSDGYYWCERGYPDGCNMCSASGGCTGVWQYPEDPFNCDPETGYPVANMASTVIFPDGDTDESIRRVFIFIDGVNADVGDFQLTIERRKWYASPCDRVNDDARVFDVTHPGGSGATYLGSLENVVNSMHAGGFSSACGGYDCGAGWSGTTSCHGSTSANQFWPNTEHFKVHRQVGEGSSSYCIQSDESFSGAADLVVEVHQRSSSSANTICDESYSNLGCQRNNLGSNARYTFTANEDELYLIGLSQYSWTNRPCLDSMGDDCDYKVSIYEGACPATCISPLETPAGASVSVTTANWNTYTTVTRTGYLSSSDGDHYYINSNDTYDEVYELNNTSGNTVDVTIEMCGTSSVGDPMIGLYQCDQSTLLAYRDVHGGLGACETLTYALPSSSDPYYITADTYGSTAIQNYTLTVTWGTPLSSCIAPSAWSTPYTGSVYTGLQTFNGSSFSAGSLSGDTTSETNAYTASGYAGRDLMVEIEVTGSGTGTMETCGGATWDTRLRFYDCEGNLVAQNDDACSLRSSITAAMDATMGTYYLLLDGYDSSSYGSFVLYF